METNWVLDDYHSLNSKQIIALFILLRASGLVLCPKLEYEHPPFAGAAMNSGYGDFVTYIMPGCEHLFKHCKRISYDKLVKMLEKEIKSKT